MPFYNNRQEADLQTRQRVTVATPDQDFAREYREGLDRTPGAATAAFIGGSAVDLLDTALSSVVPGVERQQINNTFLGAIGSPGLTNYVNENRGAMEVGSGFAGVVVSSYLAGRVLRPASMAMRAIRSVPYARSIASLDLQYARAARLASAVSRETAGRGLVGIERFSNNPIRLASLGRPAMVTSPLAASRGVYRAQAARGLALNLTTEGFMAVGLHTNDFLYTDDLAHNLMWVGAGVAIGGTIDSMIGSYTLRKMANSDKIRRLNAGAYDVSGLESQRLHSSSVVNRLLDMADGSPESLSHMFSAGGAYTDEVTSLAIAASELQRPRGITERARTLFGKREAIANPHLADAAETLNKVTVRGLGGVARSGIGTKTEGFEILVESLVREPAAMYGIEEIGTAVERMSRAETSLMRDVNLKKRMDQVGDLLANGGKWQNRRRPGRPGSGEKATVWESTLVPLADEERIALEAEMRIMQERSTWVPLTMLEAGEWMPLKMGELADNYAPRALLEEGGLGENNVKIWQRRKEAGEESLGISSQGDLFIPGNGRLESLKTEDMLTMYQIGNKAVRDFVATKTPFVVPEKANWFQLDMAEQILKASGDPAMVQFPGKMTRQSAQVEAFAQKVEQLRKREQAYRMATKRGSKEVIDDAKAFENRVYFNLPRVTSYQAGLMGTWESPVDILISGMRSGREVRQMSHEELVKALNDARKISNFTEETSDTIESLHGNSFNFLMSRDGIPVKPIIGYRRPLAPHQWTRDELFVRQALKHAHIKQTLTGPGSDPITRTIVEAITGNPNSAEARKVMELADDQSRSFVPGFRNAAPQTTEGSFMNAITSRERRDVDNLTMRAASIVKEDESRITGAVMKETIQKDMGDIITRVNSPRATDSKLLLNQFFSLRQGWILERKPVEVSLPNGKKGWAFVLDHESAINKTRFERMMNQPLTKGQRLLAPNGKEVVLDELGAEAITRTQAVHLKELAMKNTLLRSQGLPELKEVPFYVPPQQMKGKYVAYTFNVQDEVVPDMTVVADSPQDLAKQMAEIQANPAWKPGYTIRQKSSVESFMTLWDKAQMEWIAPNTTAIQPGKQNFGKSGGMLLNPNAFDEGMVTMRDNMIRHGTDILEVLFDEPIKAARARSQIARVESKVGDKAPEFHSSVYDRYVQNLLGRNALNAKDSFFGDIYDWSERRLNGILGAGQLKAGDTAQAFKDFLRVSSPTNPVQGARFEKLSQSLGKYMPYESAMEMVARETGTKTPKEVAEIATKLSWFEAGSRLRWMETMHAVATVGSIIANTPAVIRALQPMAGETLEQAAKRNSSLTMMMAVPGTKGVVVPNVPKLLWQSMKDAWSKTPDEFTQKSIRLGFMDQEVAEFQRQWGSIDSKQGWRGFVFGNEAADYGTKTGFGIRNKVARTGGLDKWMGILTDKAEAFSRSWGMYAGRRVAKAIGLEDVDAQIAFSHDLTNKIIANYDPRNRPEIFQGPLGATLGLFQSYVFGYYQRMFRYIETGNGRALATQYATQAAIFGTGSLPGWDALNWAFFNDQQGEDDDPVDSLYRRFGTADGDLIMHGVLSNIPKIFGLDGISLYTRGDSQFRMPVNPVAAVTDLIGITEGSNAAQIPVADTIKRIVRGIGAGIGAITQNNGLSAQQAAEIASNMITNRPLAGMIETFGASGYDTAWDGQVATQSTGIADSAYRILGVRAMQRQKEIDAFYANRNSQEEQAARQTQLRSITRAAIRAGNYDQVPGLFRKYVENGGSPNYYTRWVNEAFESSLDTRGERMLHDALSNKDSSDVAMIGRLLDANVDTSESDANDEDYGRQQEIDNIVNQSWEGTPDPTDPSQQP